MGGRVGESVDKRRGRAGRGKSRGQALRSGYSTGTALAAGARAALRFELSGLRPRVIAVRLPGGLFLPVPVASLERSENGVRAVVIKDGGDDPDVTHGAEIHVRLRLVNPNQPVSPASVSLPERLASVCLIAGPGVGRVTKPGLPVAVGEPAVNPVPREMLLLNLREEWRQGWVGHSERWDGSIGHSWRPPPLPHLWIDDAWDGSASFGMIAEVEVSVPRGVELARHTLNPRLGIVGGISILGTTGIVKPFSHEAYEETILAALTVARSNGCDRVVFSTGGKSEKFARGLLGGMPSEAFIQVADFFAFSVQAARSLGFREIVHSVFFGKAVKMAQGHAYTHAHRVAMDLKPLSELARDAGHGARLVEALEQANTAQHALNLHQEHGALEVVESIVRQALAQSARLAGPGLEVRLLLFDSGGSLLAEAHTQDGKSP